MTDSFSGFKTLSKEFNVSIEMIPTNSYLTEFGKSLGEVNQLHSELSDMFERTHGVSSKYIQGYLDKLVL